MSLQCLLENSTDMNQSTTLAIHMIASQGYLKGHITAAVVSNIRALADANAQVNQGEMWRCMWL